MMLSSPGTGSLSSQQKLSAAVYVSPLAMPETKCSSDRALKQFCSRTDQQVGFVCAMRWSSAEDVY